MHFSQLFTYSLFKGTTGQTSKQLFGCSSKGKVETTENCVFVLNCSALDYIIVYVFAFYIVLNSNICQELISNK